MRDQAPQQLFDGSFFEAILHTPALKITPPAPLLSPENEGQAEDETAPDVQTFDWDAYNREFFERIPNADKMSERGREMAQIAGTQIWMAGQFPPSVSAFLLLHAPAKPLFQYLSTNQNKEILAAVTKGFQRTPGIIRQPVVRARLGQWLQKTPAETYMVLIIWALSDPPIVALAKEVADGAAVRAQLPRWIKKFGLEATIAALSLAAKPRTLTTLLDWAQNPDTLARVLEKCEDEPAPGLEPQTPSTTDAHAPDSDAAHFWKAECEAAHQRERALAEALDKMLDANERFVSLIARHEAEIELLKKREKSASAGWEKKIAAVQSRFKTELDELKKGAERQGRKLRALETLKETLEIENRRFKKQLRQTGVLLEEERRKASALEARLTPAAETAAERGSEIAAEAVAEAVEAISTPVSRRTAPGKVVVVQSPTPLDEIFEWRADGRIVKITARAVRRLIDQNDEEAVGAIVQALDSLQKRDASLHGKFWKRIGNAGPYYARVLGENMARVLVDASNVARYAPNKYGKGQLRHLLGMRDELRRLDCFPIVFIADASLRYFIDDARKYHEMVAQGEIQVVDKGIEADEILAREARRTGAYVVTNDAKFFHKVSPDFEPPRVTFRIYDGTVIVDEF